MIRETGRTLLRTLLRICEDRIFASRVSWYWDIRIIIRMSGILESAKKIEKWSGVSRDTFLRDNPRWEISPNVLAMHFHQFSPLRMEEIRNDYTRDCEIQRGGERYSAWFRNMNRWMKSGEKQDLAGVENRKREIGDGEKDRWRALRKGNSFSCKISVTKSWSTRIDFVFGFDRKILARLEREIISWIYLVALHDRLHDRQITKKKGEVVQLWRMVVILWSMEEQHRFSSG